MAKRKRVAFQGERGAFSEEAAVKLVGGDVVFDPRPRFEEVFKTLAGGQVDYAVVPIENTLAGSVHENYDHLLRYKLPIVAEARVRIVHNLIARPGVKFSEIRRAFSHPVALGQCLRFFEKHPRIKSESYYDTAGSVKMIMEEAPDGVAAIASEAAARFYGGHILKRSIEDDRQNFTRFFLLIRRAGARSGPAPRGKNLKTSLVFTTPNTPGALFRCLSVFALRDINLTKIESRPLRGKPWEYLFYVDLLGSVRDAPIRNALRHLGELTDLLQVLGCYPQGD
ncbi:MAG: prephenate dehydratase [Acidobacteria bacterium]|nr:prephenate dehydratase [Acidobacteriota bacterium]